MAKPSVLPLRAAAVLGAAALILTGCKKEPPPAPAVHGARAVEGSSAPASPAQGASADAGAVQAVQAPQGPGGTVEGTVTFDGPVPKSPKLPTATDPVCAGSDEADPSVVVHDGKLANVLVRIASPELKGPAPTSPVVVNQQRCQYTPRVQGAVMGQKLEIRNEDPTLHNVHTYEDHTSLFNNAQPPGAPPILKPLPKDPGMVQVKCDIHEWMQAYVYVSPNPWFATSDQKGHFVLKDVPPGKYTLEAWHERFGKRTATVEVKPNQTAQVSFRFNALPPKK